MLVRPALSLRAGKVKIGWHCDVSAGVDLVNRANVLSPNGGRQKVFYYSASFPLEVAELQVVLAAFLLGEEGAEGVQLSFGWVALASNVHLVVPTVDKVWGDGSGEPFGAWWWRYKTQADVALKAVTVGAARGCSSQVTVTVDGLPPPRPQVKFSVMVL